MSSGGYKMNSIVQKTGFSSAVLRAWERRHGLLEPERSAGGHRLYTDDDLRVLQRIRELLAEGRSIGEVARMGRALLLEQRAPAPDPRGERLDRWKQRLVEAAVAIDGPSLERVLDEAFALVSAPEAIEHAVVPALETIGNLWASGQCSIAGEHLASAKVAGRLLKLLQVSDRAADPHAPLAIAACLPDEQHQLGALVTAYTLSRYGFRVSYLGASMPLEDLERTSLQLQPNLVCLSVMRAALLETHAPRLRELVERSPVTTAYVIGGRGVAHVDTSELERAGLVVVRSTQDLEDLLRASPR